MPAEVNRGNHVHFVAGERLETALSDDRSVGRLAQHNKTPREIRRSSTGEMLIMSDRIRRSIRIVFSMPRGGNIISL